MAGRPNKYDTHVKPRFNEITEWLQIGATEKEIAEKLGVNQKVFGRYKKQYSELNALIKKGRKAPVEAIKRHCTSVQLVLHIQKVRKFSLKRMVTPKKYIQKPHCLIQHQQ